VTRPRAADDFGTIRARIEELRRERAQAERDSRRVQPSGGNEDPLRDIERRRKEKCEGWPPPWVPTIFLKTRRSSSRVESTPLSSGRHPPAVDVVSGTRGVARALGARPVPPAPMPRIGARRAFPISRPLRRPPPATRAAAGIDRRLAEAEFRPYIRAGRDYQYRNTVIGNHHYSIPMQRRPVPSPAIPLIDRFGPLIGENTPLFVSVERRLVSV
jgi:hypothetical protein